MLTISLSLPVEMSSPSPTLGARHPHIVSPSPSNAPEFGLKYRVLCVLLTITGLCFRRYGMNGKLASDSEQSMVEKFARLVFSIGYMSVVAYILICFIYATSVIPEALDMRGDVIRTYIMVIWMIQVFFTMLIMFYWELRDYNRPILVDCLQYETQIDVNFRADWHTRLFLFGFSVLIIVRMLELVFGVIQTIRGENIMERLMMYEILATPFGPNTGVVLTSILVLHIFSTLLISLLYYGLLSFAMRHRLQYLKLELESLGVERQGKIGDSMDSTFYFDYRKLMQAVLQLNQHFQPYRILTMVFCVGLATFGIYAFANDDAHKSWSDYIHLIIETAMVVMILMILIYPISAIKSTLGHVKYILYYNSQLWQPYDPKRYELNKLYAEMAGLVAECISVWGTQYARKPFFVTLGFIGFVGLTAARIINPLSIYK